MNKTYFITNDMSIEQKLDALSFFTFFWAIGVNVKFTPVENNLYNVDEK